MTKGDFVRHVGLDNAFGNNRWLDGCLWQLVEVGPDYAQGDLVVGEVPPWVGPNRRMTLWKRSLEVVDTLDAMIIGL